MRGRSPWPASRGSRASPGAPRRTRQAAYDASVAWFRRDFQPVFTKSSPDSGESAARCSAVVEHLGPIVLDADHRPAFLRRLFERGLGAVGVVELALGIVVKDE